MLLFPVCESEFVLFAKISFHSVFSYSFHTGLHMKLGNWKSGC